MCVAFIFSRSCNDALVDNHKQQRRGTQCNSRLRNYPMHPSMYSWRASNWTEIDAIGRCNNFLCVFGVRNTGNNNKFNRISVENNVPITRKFTLPDFWLGTHRPKRPKCKTNNNNNNKKAKIQWMHDYVDYATERAVCECARDGRPHSNILYMYAQNAVTVKSGHRSLIIIVSIDNIYLRICAAVVRMPSLSNWHLTHTHHIDIKLIDHFLLAEQCIFMNVDFAFCGQNDSGQLAVCVIQRCIHSRIICEIKLNGSFPRNVGVAYICLRVSQKLSEQIKLNGLWRINWLTSCGCFLAHSPFNHTVTKSPCSNTREVYRTHKTHSKYNDYKIKY